MSDKLKYDPCCPCLCPQATCEQCSFGYKDYRTRANMLDNILENNTYPGIVENFNIQHPYAVLNFNTPDNNEIQKEVSKAEEITKQKKAAQVKTDCIHDYFLGSKTQELTKSSSEGFECWEHYKIGSIICRKCGEVKQIILDKYTDKIKEH